MICSANDSHGSHTSYFVVSGKLDEAVSKYSRLFVEVWKLCAKIVHSIWEIILRPPVQP